MATKYIPKPQIECHNCGNLMTKTRPSATGHYYCARFECQKQRRKTYNESRRVSTVTTTEAEHAARLADSAKFLWHALYAPRKQCPACGLFNALPGYQHPTEEGRPCSELGADVPGVTVTHIFSAWPDGVRKYGVTS